MAITINTNPDSISKAYSEVKWTATSDDGNIKAIRCDIYIGGTYNTTIDGVQVLSTSNQFTFDISKVMQSILQSELRTNITTFQITDATTSTKAVKVRLFEITESSGVYVTDWAEDGAGTGYEESSTVDVINTAVQHLEDFGSYEDLGDGTKKLLTLRDGTGRIPRDCPFQVGVVGTDVLISAKVVVSSATAILSTTQTATVASFTDSKAIIEIPASLYSDPTALTMTLTLYESVTNKISNVYNYKIVDVCDHFILFFQNHLGGFDHFDFSNKVVKNVNTKTQNITKPLPSGFSSEDAGQITVDSQVATKIKVSSGALSQNEINLVAELIRNHSVVYRWIEAGVFEKYVVKSHSTKIEDNDGFINSLSLVLEPSNDWKTQKGE